MSPATWPAAQSMTCSAFETQADAGGLLGQLERIFPDEARKIALEGEPAQEVERQG